jgi:hypothetical protein
VTEFLAVFIHGGTFNDFKNGAFLMSALAHTVRFHTKSGIDQLVENNGPLKSSMNVNKMAGVANVFFG